MLNAITQYANLLVTAIFLPVSTWAVSQADIHGYSPATWLELGSLVALWAVALFVAEVITEAKRQRDRGEDLIAFIEDQR